MAYNLFLPGEYIKNSERISVLSTGDQQLFKSGPKYFIYTNIIVIAELCSGVSGDPAFSVGTNSPNYDNLISGTTYTGLGTTGKVEIFNAPDATIFSSLAPSTDVFINVTAAATGSTYDVQIVLLGFYLNDNYN
jgi:hypothetical protein